MKKGKKAAIIEDVGEYLDSIADAPVAIPAETMKSLLYEIGICNWRQVTNIANEIRDSIA
jgi:hypothetical protein